MPGGKKLVVALAVLAAGAGAASFFRKDASLFSSRHEAQFADPFRQRIERRVTTDAAWTRVLGVRPAADLQPAQRVMPAAASIPQGLAAESQPTFQKSLNPVGALLEPLESVPADDPPSPAADPGPRGQNSPGVAMGQTHQIVDGDTLSRLAQEYLGNSERYLEIFEFNRDLLSSPDLLPIGKVLRIPPGVRPPADPPSRQAPPTSEPPLELVPVVAPGAPST